MSHLETHFSENQIKTQNFSFMKVDLKMLYVKWWPWRDELNALFFKHMQMYEIIVQNSNLHSRFFP